MNKYGAVKTKVDNITFHSKKEANRYRELVLMQRAGIVSELQLQPKFPITINGDKVCTYIADFQYFDHLKGHTVVEDAKGVLTPIYRLKKRLLHAVCGIEILET